MKDSERIQVGDTWRKAILAERKIGKIHELMKEGLLNFKEMKDTALILGDASLVQSKYLIEVERFSKVVDVDSSPSLLDDGPVRNDDKRVEKVLMSFDKFIPSPNTFDFIYGKSIAFSSKENILSLLNNLNRSLKEKGIFCASWGGEGDSFKSTWYTEEELKKLYLDSNFEIIKIDHIQGFNKGIVRPGIEHIIDIIAKKFD